MVSFIRSVSPVFALDFLRNGAGPCFVVPTDFVALSSDSWPALGGVVELRVFRPNLEVFCIESELHVTSCDGAVIMVVRNDLLFFSIE